MTLPAGPRRIGVIAFASVVATAALTITVYVVVHHPPSVYNKAGACICGPGPGFQTCIPDPDNCDSGDRSPGGTIVVAVDKAPRGWNPGSIRGGVDAAEELTPVLPSASLFLPTGKITYNRDLFTTEPQVPPTHYNQIVYRISPHAVWNDGTGRAHPVTAQDFVFAWRALDGHDKNLPTLPGSGYERITGVVGSDDGQTVTVTFKQPYADWRGLFTRLEPYWFAAAKSGADPADATHMTDAQLEKAFDALDEVPKFSAGPYMIKEVGLDRTTVEVPNPLWYGTTKPTLTSITFRETNDRQNVRLLQNKEIDVFSDAPDAETVTELSNTAGISYHVLPGYAAERLQFNTKDPFLRDAELREAIMDAIDVGALIDKTLKPLFPDARRLYSHSMLPGEAGYQDIIKQVDPVEGTGDSDAAKKLLAAAGYTGIGRADSLKTPDGRHVTFSFVHTDNPVRDQSSQVIRDDLAGLGITVTDRPTSDLGGTLTARRFGIVEYGLAYSPLLAPTVDLWSTHGASNFTGWGDPRSDQLLGRMTRTLDVVEQANLLNQQDQILTRAHVDLPLYQRPQLIALDIQYVNIRLNPAGGYITYNTQEWGLLKAAS